MTDEDRERQMDFILESLGRSERRIDRLERTLKLAVTLGRRERREWRIRYNALIDAQIKNEDITRQNSENIRQNSENITILLNSQMETGEIVRRNSQDIANLHDSLTETKEIVRRNSQAINQLADIVRQMAERPNGNSGK